MLTKGSLPLQKFMNPVDGFNVFVLFWILTALSNIPIRLYYRGGPRE